MSLPAAEQWFEPQRFSDDITLIREPHVLSAAYANMWHVTRDEDKFSRPSKTFPNSVWLSMCKWIVLPAMFANQT